MPVTHAQVVEALALCDADELRALAEAAEVRGRDAEAPRALAEAVARALWWSYQTPLGYVGRDVPLDDIVEHVARRLGVDGALAGADAWDRLEAMTRLLAGEVRTVRLEDLDPKTRARLARSPIPTLAFASGSTGSFGSAVVGRGILRLAATPVGRLLPYVPRVGPAFRTITRGAGVAARVGTPLGIAFAVLSVNQALGADYHRLVPLLLGVGALRPPRVADAVELATT